MCYVSLTSILSCEHAWIIVGSIAQVLDFLQAWLPAMFPALSRPRPDEHRDGESEAMCITHQWTGVIGDTPDFEPVVTAPNHHILQYFFKSHCVASCCTHKGWSGPGTD